jgi:uncharacterized protein YjiK
MIFIYIIQIFITAATLLHFTSCNSASTLISAGKLTLISSHQLTVSEPSDLSLSDVQGEFFTVSDETGKIYRISSEGVTLETLNYTGDDLEGITYHEGYLYAAEEEFRQIVKLDMDGYEKSRKTIDISVRTVNKGLEGLTCDSNSNRFFAVTEQPGLLIEIDSELNKISETDLTFAEDYSGIFFDSRSDSLWILSDESHTVTKCDFRGSPQKSYSIDEIEQPEGIAIDFSLGRIYFVCDKSSRLYVYRMPE